MTTTRWWLEGRAGSARLGLVREVGRDDDPECPVPAPERPARVKWGIIGDHAGWLAVDGVGVVRGHEGGAHGWIEGRSTARRDPTEVRRRGRR